MAQAVVWHRQVAAMVEAADRAGVAADDLPELRTRLATQAGVLTHTAARLGGMLPALLPTPAEIATAGSTLGDLSAPAIAGAVRTMQTTLTAVDAALGVGATMSTGDSQARTVAAPAAPQRTAVGPGPATEVGVPPSTSDVPSLLPSAPAGPIGIARRGVLLRNTAVYGAYAAVVLAVQVVLFVFLDEVHELPAAAPLCLLVLPALAWLAGFLTVGALVRAGPGEKPDRTPRLGAAVCLIPNALLCGAVVVLFLVS